MNIPLATAANPAHRIILKPFIPPYSSRIAVYATTVPFHRDGTVSGRVTGSVTKAMAQKLFENRAE
jgi:hypothetical protein